MTSDILRGLLLGSTGLVLCATAAAAQPSLYPASTKFADVFGRDLAVRQGDMVLDHPTLAQARQSDSANARDAVAALDASLAGPSGDCVTLAGLKLPWVKIRSAQQVDGEKDTRSYCKLTGIIDKEITFEVDMPAPAAWNGKFVMGGSGGFLGNLQNGIKPAALARGYATAVTDTGHPIPADGGGSWALHDPMRLVNFGHRGTHLAAANAKLVIQAYYKKAIARSYFYGSSGSGRQAMMEAERYPGDFMGIIAACPAYSWTQLNVFATGWTQQQMYPTAERQYQFQPVVPPQKVRALDDAVYAKCDALDGVQDGVITNPLACHFNPRTDLKLCAAGEDNAQCFTSEQQDVIARIHAGPSNADGAIWPGWAYGGEAIPGMWTAPNGGTAYVIGNRGGSAPYSSRHYLLTNETMRYLVFNDPGYDLHSFNFETDIPATLAASAVVDANNPDLGGFEKRGGRLIMSVGWSDWAVDDLAVKGFYDQIVRTNGGQSKVSGFARLFMLPGVGHCFATDPARKTPNNVDLLTALENWVERDKAPDQIIASHVVAATGNRNPPLSMPVAGTVDRTRPICAYPRIAAYKGSGSIDDATSFTCKS
jgi:feruloyl esterase